ncbi:TlpA family protein disulfide reductase [Mucilaginibacter sp.]
MQLFYLKGEFSKDSLQHIYNNLKPEFKNSSYGQRIATYLKVGDILKEGDSYTDFEAMDKDGKKHRLSDIKGKYVLLDFSATYCGPCVSSITDLKNISRNYSDKVEIITFSADGGKGTWIEGLKRDNPTWLSLWDGKGNYGETMLKYGINGYPTFVVIDPQGKIISKVMGYDKPENAKGNIETKIDEVMAKSK